jgi:hypothetical protein
MPALLKKLRAALYGVEVFDPQQHSELSQQLVRHLEFQQSPASYLLGVALEDFAGQKLPSGDKKAWQALLVFKGAIWHLHDWKNSSWTLNGPPDSDSVREELVKKLRSATSFIQRRLESRARSKIKAEDFAIANQFGRLESYYWSLRSVAEVILSLSLPVNAEPPEPILLDSLPDSAIRMLDTGGINDYFKKWREADAAAAGAVMLFFGLMEVLFDACFAFGDRKGLTYSEFRNKDWKERFRFVVDITAPLVEKIYCDLARVQKRFRNVFAHALPTRFVFDDRLGSWIPEEIDDLTEPRMNLLYAFDKEEVRSTFAVFDAAISFFENSETTWAATMYAKTPLPIPLAPERLAALVKCTVTRDAFEKEIERRIEAFEAFVNGGV